LKFLGDIRTNEEMYLSFFTAAKLKFLHTTPNKETGASTSKKAALNGALIYFRPFVHLKARRL
jgi:hypothetical protein